MRQAIINFPKQLEWDPAIENAANLRSFKRYIVVGMGGSHLAADLLKVWGPCFPVIVHRNYGLPCLSEGELRESLIIASSYSGNTEETLDAYSAAKKNGLAVAAVSVGGKLLDAAKKDGIPYVRIPDTGIQPRAALGFSLRALLALCCARKEDIEQLSSLSKIISPEQFEEKGRNLAAKIKGFIPVIYSSEHNQPIAYNWKIKFNETGKIPAFSNVFPEINHNEMTGFDFTGKSKKLSEKFLFIFLKDPQDNPHILKRMETLERLLQNRKFQVITQELQGGTVFHKIFSSLLLADWAAYYTALQYGAEPEQVPMVEEFKGLL